MNYCRRSFLRVIDPRLTNIYEANASIASEVDKKTSTCPSLWAALEHHLRMLNPTLYFKILLFFVPLPFILRHWWMRC